MNASGLTRAFVAVVPPADVRDAIAAHLRGGDIDVEGWTVSQPQQWHVTLEFLGRLDDTDAEVDRLRAIAAATDAFELGLGGAGAFPVVDRARVVWLDVAQGARELTALAEGVRDRAATSTTHGADAGTPFRAHLTVARSSRPRDATVLVETLAAPRVGPAWTVEAIELVSSETHPDGARYTTVGRLPMRV